MRFFLYLCSRFAKTAKEADNSQQVFAKYKFLIVKQ